MFKSLIAKILKDEHFKDLVSGSSAVMLFKVLGMGAGYLFNLVLARNAGATITGIYTTCFTIITLLVTFGKLGMGNASVKFIAAFKASKDHHALNKMAKIATVSVSLSLVLLGLLVLLLRSQIAIWYKEPLLVEALAWAALVIPLKGLMIINGEILRGLRDMVGYGIFQIGSVRLLESAFLFLAFYFGFNQPELAIQVLCISMALVVVISFIRRKAKMPKGDAKLGKLELKEVFAVSMPMMVTSSTYVIMSLLDVLVLGYFQDQSEVGIYGIAFKVSALITVPLFAINSMAAPKFAHFNGLNDKKNLIKVARQSAKLNLLASLPLFVGILIFGPWLLSLFGNEFKAGATVLGILAIGQFYNTACGSVLNLLNMAGKEKVNRNIILFTTILNLVLNIFLAKNYGAWGVAIATSISLFTWNTLGVLAVKKYYGFWMLPNPFKAAK